MKNISLQKQWQFFHATLILAYNIKEAVGEELNGSIVPSKLLHKMAFF